MNEKRFRARGRRGRRARDRENAVHRDATADDQRCKELHERVDRRRGD
jgi:hypothetical protein